MKPGLRLLGRLSLYLLNAMKADMGVGDTGPRKAVSRSTFVLQ